MMTATIKCGNCGSIHHSVNEVKGCYIAAGKLGYRAAKGLPRHDSYQMSGEYYGDPSAEEFDAAVAELQSSDPEDTYQFGGADVVEFNEIDLVEARRVSPYRMNSESSASSFLGIGTSSEERVYLNVPFLEKDRAKSDFGARWDRERRQWWVTQSVMNEKAADMPDNWYLGGLSSEPGSLSENERHGKATPVALKKIDEDGIYRIHDEWIEKLNADIVKVQMNRDGTALYAKRMVKLYPESITDKAAIKKWCEEQGIKKPVKWEYTPGLMTFLAEDRVTKLNKNDAKEFGSLYGICMRCGAFLTNEDSIERMMGPICAGKW